MDDNDRVKDLQIHMKKINLGWIDVYTKKQI